MSSGDAQNVDLPLWELMQTAWVVARGFGDVLTEAGLTPGQFGALRCLADQDGLIQAELARRLTMRPQSLGEIVTSLLERGLVERHGPAGRGRRAELSLTELGHATLGLAWPRVCAYNVPTAGLTSQEATTLVALLQTVRHTLSNPTSGPRPDGL